MPEGSGSRFALRRTRSADEPSPAAESRSIRVAVDERTHLLLSIGTVRSLDARTHLRGEVTMNLKALAAVGSSQFDSKRELLDALHPVFEEYRASGGGIFSQLRALLPF